MAAAFDAEKEDASGRWLGVELRDAFGHRQAVVLRDDVRLLEILHDGLDACSRWWPPRRRRCFEAPSRSVSGPHE